MFTEEMLRAISGLLNDDKVRLGQTPYIEKIRKVDAKLEPHFSTDYPEHLLKTQHPGEEEWAVMYRKANWTNPVYPATGRIFSTLQRIQQSDDFKIHLNDDEITTGIGERISFADYLYKYQPKFKSLETWAFQPFLKQFLKGANAVVATLPDISKWIKNPDSFINWSLPFPQIFESKFIVYKTSESVIIKVESHKDEKGLSRDQFIIIAAEGLILARQEKDYGPNVDAFVYYFADFKFDEYPVINVGSVISELVENQPVFESVIQPSAESWNEVLFRHSDLKVNWAMVGNPQKWELVGNRCKTCNGTGTIGPNKKFCNDCNNTGESKGSPFKTIEINIQAPNVNNPQAVVPPIPPAGYVTRDTDSLSAQKEDIDQNLYRGFQAVGLELLANIPAPQSGIAKMYDRKEMNTFFFQVAVHLVDVYIFCAKQEFLIRYKALGVLPTLSKEKIEENEPKITIPTDFDILTSEMIAEMLSKALKDDYSPIITSGLEYQFAEKMFGESSPQAKFIKTQNALDPLAFLTTDEKLVLKESGGCTSIDYVLSNYIKSFMVQLIEQDDKWMKKDRRIQRADLLLLAKQKEAEIKASIVPEIRIEA